MNARPLSIIVPCYRCAAGLPLLLDELARQLGPDDEILVIDDCSPDDTAAVARAYGATVYTMPENFGVGRCRNDGIRRARHDDLVFFDDDVVPMPGYLDTARRYFADADIAIFQGPNTADTVYPNPNIWEQTEAIMWHHSQVTKWVRNGKCSTLYSGHFCARRPFLIEIGLFLENFGGAGGEEFEFAGRILAKSEIIFAPELLSVHQPKSLSPRLRAIFKRSQYYARIFKGQTVQEKTILDDKIRFALAWLILFAALVAVFAPGLGHGVGIAVALFIAMDWAILRDLWRWGKYRFIPVMEFVRVLQYWTIGFGMAASVLGKLGFLVKPPISTLGDSGTGREEEIGRAGKN